jgi:predicted PurR-regulated permease PerM
VVFWRLRSGDAAGEDVENRGNDQPVDSSDSRLVSEEVHQAFVSVTETEGDITRGQTVGSITESKVFRPVGADDDDDMPLPTDPRTFFLAGLFVIACMAVLYVAAEIVLPLLLALVLKLLLQPLVRLLEDIRIPRGVGAFLSVLLVLVAFGGTISMLAGPAADWAGKLPEAIPKLKDSLSFLQGPIDAFQGMMKQIEGVAGDVGPAPQGSGIPGSALLGAVLSRSATATSGVFTTLLILFYMLVSGETFLRRMVEILPRFKDKRQAVELSLHIERDVSAYLLTVFCINAVVGVATGCVMWACGVANPVLWGAIAFVLNFVPILGAMVGVVIFLMVSVLSLGVTWWALLPVGLYFGIHMIEGEFVTPMLLAKRFTINPVALILALIFWYWMWGVPGAILAVPLLAITKIVCDDLRPLRAFGHLLEG